jgi:outer membrane protein OmpA-like peptidoglycan-associated protein
MACSAFAQSDTSATRYHLFIGIFGGYGASLEQSNLVIPLPGYAPACGTLVDGSAMQWWAGALVERPIAEWFALQLRPFVAGAHGSLTGSIPGTRPLSNGGEIVNASIDHELDFTTTSLGLGLLGRLELAGRLHAQAGIEVEHWIRSDRSYRQIIADPSDLLFSNGRRDTVPVPSGAYRATSVLLGTELGLSYDLPISRRSTLSPEIMASLPLNSRTPDGAWFSFALRAGAALRFGFPRAEDSIHPPPPETTLVVPHPPALVTAVATEPRVVSVQIDERDSLEMLSLLNQIYFAEGSSDLRSVYRTLTPDRTSAFSDTTLLGSALDVYYDILNIVGYRMRTTLPGATLTINGYRNGKEPKGALARSRAESIRRYLTEVWNVPSERIKVKGGGSPPNPSRENTSEGLEENARAELSASDPNLLGPILRRHVIRTATPPELVFYPQALAEAGVAVWTLETFDEGNRPWRTFNGRGALPDSILWNWQSNAGELPTLPMHLDYRLSVTDSAGRTTTTAAAEIDVVYNSVRHKLEHRENDTTIETYSLLLFDFDNPKVSASDRDLLELIGSIIRSKSSVRLIGYTDSLGDEEHNHELANARADEVARILRKLLPRDVEITVDESGGEHERFPYNTPEGRTHCRTVFIEVRTPTLPDGM